MTNNIKKQLTQRKLNKMREKSRFEIEPIKDFITPKNRLAFGHICDKCCRKNTCTKWYGAIILKCEEFKQRYQKDYIQ